MGQLIGDCLTFCPTVELNAPTAVTFKVLPDIARNAAFTQVDLAKQNAAAAAGTIDLQPLGASSASLEATAYQQNF